MNHFFNKLEGAEAVSVQGQVSGVVNAVEGLVYGHQFSSIVGSSGPYTPWVDGETPTFFRDVDSCPNLVGLGGLAFDEAAVCVGLEACGGDGLVGAGEVRVGRGGRWAFIGVVVPGYGEKGFEFSGVGDVSVGGD